MEKVFTKKNKPLWICLIMIAFFGVLMSFMVPTWQTPDENNHVWFVGDAFGIKDMELTLIADEGMGFDRIRFNYDEKVDYDEWKESLTKAPTYDESDVTPSDVSLPLIKHLPQSVGIFIGIGLHLPTFWVMTLGELFSFAFYFVLLIISLKLMPVQKELFLVLSSLPMMIQQVASVNYDSVLLSLCMLFVAYIFHLRYMNDKVKWKHILLMLILILIITYIKVPYGLLLFFVCIVPKEKFELKIGKFVIDERFIRIWRIPFIIAIIVIMVISTIMLRDKIYYLDVIAALFEEPRRALFLFANTLKTWYGFLFTSFIGQFGWLDAPLPGWFVLLTFGVLIFLAVTGGKSDIKWSTRVFTWVIVFVLGAFIFISMIDFTIQQLLGKDYGSYNEALYSIPYFGGFQGRYFIPFVPFAFYVLPKLKFNWNWRKWIPVAYIALAIIVSTVTLYNRYWA